MITQGESGLTVGDYSELLTVRTGATYNLTLQRLSFAWSSISAGSEIAEFDADTTSEQILRAVLASGTLTVDRDDGTGSWSELWTLGSIIATVTPAVWAGSGDTVRVFYYKSGSLYYNESADEGDTWGGAVEIGALANVAWIAPVSLTKLHIATYDNYNTRLHFYEDDGGWAITDSTIYYPEQFTSFDAETIDGRDVILFTAQGQERYDTSRQGVWCIRQKGASWSDPLEIDVLDEYEEGATERASVRVNLIDSNLFATYVGQDAGFEASCYTVSSAGRFWQHRQPLGNIAIDGKLVELGDYTYLVGGVHLYRSASTPLVGNSTVEHDITSRVTKYSTARSKAHQAQLVIDNDDGGLVDLTDFTRWQLVEKVGYWADDGDELLIQTALSEIDTVDVAHRLPVSEVRVTSRDHMAWLMDRTEADHYEELDSQLRHWDDYENTVDSTTQKEILHSGMGYTATMTGYWSTEDNELKLSSNNKEGLALCTVAKFLGHTIVQEAVQVPTSGNSEWAGVVFRALDEDNYWLAYYDQTTDKIKLKQKREGTFQADVAETSALSWSVATWYWIRVEARLSRFVVYYSADGATFTQAFAYVDTNIVHRGLAAFKEGYVGHNGYGYSNEDTDPYEPPAYVPPDISYPTYTIYDQFVVGTDNGAAYAETEDVISGGTPTWAACGLSGETIQQIMLRQENNEAWAVTDTGIYRTPLPFSGSSSWICVVSLADGYTATGLVDQGRFYRMDASWLNPNKYWINFQAHNGSKFHTYCLITTNGWVTCSAHRIGTGQSSFRYGGGLSVGHDGVEGTVYATAGKVDFGGALYKSTDGGESWTEVANGGSYGTYNGVIVHPADPDVILSNEGATLRLSENGGSSWVWSENPSETITSLSYRSDGVGVPMLYGTTVKRAYQYSAATNAMINAETYSSPWIDWYGAAQPSGLDMLANDAKCVGWGTDNKFGWVISVGSTEIDPDGPEVQHTDDYGNYVYVTQNLKTVLSSATEAKCIGWEGGEWDE